MNKKYELLTDQTITVLGVKLFRIRALVAFGDVAAGDLGGYIEKKDNLQVFGQAWVYGKARVYGKAQVYGEARVYGEAWVFGEARVYGKAQVFGKARVYGEAWVFGKARVYGKAQVYGEAQVYGQACITLRCGIFVAQHVGSENGTLTVFTAKVGVLVTRGCYIGNPDEFLTAVNAKHGANSKIGKEYRLLIEVALSRVGGDV